VGGCAWPVKFTTGAPCAAVLRRIPGRLLRFVNSRSPDHAGEGAKLGVIILHRPIVIAPRDLDAILRPFQLRLQRQEILVGFEIG